MKTALLCLALLVASGKTTAQQKFDLSDANVTRAVNELSGEMLECAVFFAIGAQCVRRHPDQSVPGVATDAMTGFQDMLDLARKTGRTVGVSDAAATGRRNSHRCDVEGDGAVNASTLVSYLSATLIFASNCAAMQTLA
jgi:hypothetical protein